MFQLVAEMYVQGPAIDMLAVFGDAEMRLRQAGVSLRRAVGRQDRRTLLADGLHDAGEEIHQRHIDPDLFAGMIVAQEHRKFFHDPGDRPVVVPIQAAEGFAGMRVFQVEPLRLRRWQRNGTDHFGKDNRAGD